MKTHKKLVTSFITRKDETASKKMNFPTASYGESKPALILKRLHKKALACVLPRDVPVP